ncbi:ATP-binding protein [Micromonospora sp. WMMD1076]|uniref:ATP-binding protein n=1 Tax=Micromonospora sp. WMMD1076 TaxID=3016103 RepID=UPI00249C5A64|nr:ATP-binding protein [Micromonospora sp. WMMD1076]WFF07012.1 ATP-binding protein [Micromonospora sp. WMMD1076]
MAQPSDPVLGVKLATLKTIFRPSSPVDDRELFRGRRGELARVISAVQELGQHAVIFGDRGVGKTSLAYMAKDSFRSASPDASLAVRIPCSADDNFASIWKKFIPRVVAELDLLPEEMRESIQPLVDRSEDILDFDELGPESVGRALHVLANAVPLLVVLDEFDRIGDIGSAQLFSDLVKTISDDLVRCTLLIVGVADNVDDLIANHRSVERAIRQISMPRMSPEELREVVVGGFATFATRSGVEIRLAERVVNAIVHLSQGLPYYAHLLAGSIGEIALIDGVQDVDFMILPRALSRALDEAQQSIRSQYTEAVSSARQNAQFPMTLLACALTRVDDVGYFAPADVRTPLAELTGTYRDTSYFLHHLRRFADEPSWILDTKGEGRRVRYRFSNPLMRPFVLMKGFRDGYLDPQTGSPKTR